MGATPESFPEVVRPMGAHPHRRRRRSKLPRPGLQLRMIGAFAGISVLAILVQALVFGAQLVDVAQRLPDGGLAMTERIPGTMGRSLLLAFGLLLPALLLIGIHVTFRVAGPLYRMQRHLESVARGEWPDECRIREGDDLQDFCAVMNSALNSAYRRGYDSAGAATDRAAA